MRILSVSRPSGPKMSSRSYAAAHAAPKTPVPAKPTISPAQMGQKLLEEDMKNPLPFSRERLEKMADTLSKPQIQQMITAYKAALPKVNTGDDLMNDPELSAIIRQAQELPRTLLARDPFREVRERLGSSIPMPRPEDVPSPRFFFEIIRIAEEEVYFFCALFISLFFFQNILIYRL